MQLARGGRRRAAARLCLAASVGCLTKAVLETGAACRISSVLQAAAGSIFSPPPQLPWVEREGGREVGEGGGLSRRGELKVNVCRHNGEGLPPHGGGLVSEEHVESASHAYLLCQPLTFAVFFASTPCVQYSAEVSLVSAELR